MKERRKGAVFFALTASLLLLVSCGGSVARTLLHPDGKPDEAVGGLEIDMERGIADIDMVYRFVSGDTLFSVLLSHGLTTDEANAAVAGYSRVSDPRRIKEGQKLIIRFKPGQNPLFTGFTLEVDPAREVVVYRTGSGDFISYVQYRELSVSHRRVDGTIVSPLYSAALDSGLPLNTLHDLIYLYSFDIDFQREVQSGDTFSVLFEQFRDDSGRVVRDGDILYAMITVGGKEREVFRFSDAGGEPDYFDGSGKSARKTLLKTPISGAHITSGYGMRVSPVLGYSRFHPAIDFAAREGTPIYAAGDGTVTEAGYNDVYGNYIRLSHANGYGTLYGHLSGYASGVRRGAKVKQGSVIGYVGNTGMSTGPHLHYEVTYQGRQINPALLNFPPGKILRGDELARFEESCRLLRREFDRHPISASLRVYLRNIPQ